MASQMDYLYLQKDVTEEFFETLQSYKRRENVMTRCRVPEICE